jgi:formylglycine-generating enzyme required for sulfatase activity
MKHLSGARTWSTWTMATLLGVTVIAASAECVAESCETVVISAGSVCVEAGTFWMGSPDGCPGPSGYPSDCTAEPGRSGDEVLHQVTLTRSFILQDHEVTQGEWREVFGNSPSNFGSCGNDCPVETVNWWEAIAYVNALSVTENLDSCYTLSGCTNNPGESMACTDITVNAAGGNPYLCEGYRLPTESEWEYAYRAGALTAFYNGDITSLSCADPNLDEIGWYCGNSSATTHVWGQKLPNGFGLYDMPGNVWEWVWDYYGFYPGDVTDPTGPNEGSLRVVRGGAWDDSTGDCRAASRFGDGPGLRVDLYGFRPARTVTAPTPIPSIHPIALYVLLPGLLIGAGVLALRLRS